ncbi:MAG: hypothetical protein L6Q66_03830 [Bacteroidia bacterium]|nr:hypothetical protein [Bacteroidia bacterium]
MIFFLAIPYLLFLVFVFVNVMLNLSRAEKQSNNVFVNIVMIFSEVVFTIVGPIIGFIRFDEFMPEIPFAKQHVLSIILLVIFSSLSYWISRLSSGSKSPFLKIFLSVGLLQGILLCTVVTIHFITFLPMGLIFPFAGFELLAPPMALVMLIKEFYFLNKETLDLPELLPYRAELGFIPLPYKIWQKPLSNRLLIYLFLLIIALLAQILFCLFIGQDVDSIIKAFTHSKGFLFSRYY